MHTQTPMLPIRPRAARNLFESDHNDLTQYLHLGKDSVRSHSRWLKFGPLNVYLRVGRYVPKPDNSWLLTAGVANINIDPRRQGQGVFKLFILALEYEAKFLGYERLQFEQTMNSQLGEWLAKHGYSAKVVEGDNPTFFKCLTGVAV